MKALPLAIILLAGCTNLNPDDVPDDHRRAYATLPVPEKPTDCQVRKTTITTSSMFSPIQAVTQVDTFINADVCRRQQGLTPQEVERVRTIMRPAQ